MGDPGEPDQRKVWYADGGILPGHVELDCGAYRISLDDVEREEAEGASQKWRLPEGETTLPTTTVRVASHGPDGQQRAQYVLIYHAPSDVGDRSALYLADNLVFIVGSYAICMTPSLQAVIWQRNLDTGSGYGVYAAPQEEAIIVHGELAITKLALDGTIQWQTAGRDIFTDPFELQDDRILATDWDGTTYTIQVATGQITHMLPGGRARE